MLNQQLLFLLNLHGEGGKLRMKSVLDHVVVACLVPPVVCGIGLAEGEGDRGLQLSCFLLFLCTRQESTKIPERTPAC